MDAPPNGRTQVEAFIPILKLGHCCFVSVPSELSDSQATLLQESIASRLVRERTVTGLVIDLSALGVVDSFGAKTLGETANIAKSFGTQAVLVGLRPEVAITLVELGIDLRSVETALTLERALEKLSLRIVSTK